MSDTHIMEMLGFDDEGVEICKPIVPQKYIELKIKGYDLALGFSDDLAKHFEKVGLEKIASGLYPDGSRWYRFKPKGDCNAKEE